MKRSRLDELTGRFPSHRVAVLGDFFLDQYLDVDPALEERSLETGKRAHQAAAVRSSPGAAGTVVNNLASLGCGRVHAVGITGDDGQGFELRQCLDRIGCTTRGLRRRKTLMTPTYLKPRDLSQKGLSGEHERYDIRNRDPIPPDLLQEMLADLEGLLDQVDAVIIEDQVEEPDLGVVTQRVRDALANLADRHSRILFWADSRAHIHRFRRMILKPNQFEAMTDATPGPGERVSAESIRRILPRFRAKASAPICVTLGAAGALVTDPEITRVPAVRVEGPVDVTGAGDSFTAGAVLALCGGASLPEAALVGNLAASVTIRQLAVTGTATRRQLARRLALWNEQNEEQIS